MPDILQDRRADTFAAPRSVGGDTELLSPETQIIGDQDVYLGTAGTEIGRRVADDQLELFVVCQPAEAMHQQFSQRPADFITLHDVGTASSARLLAAVAAAASRKVQKLVIRRQGYGVPLATLQFVELPLQPGRHLRVYTTQIDADTQTRHQLAHVLLAHSRLGVIMFGDLPAHALDSSLQPLRETIARGPWPNRQLLLVPLASAAALPAQAAAMAGTSGVMVRTTPQVSRPAEAWSFISGAWNRIGKTAAETEAARPAASPSGASAPASTTAAAAPAAAPAVRTRPLDLSPMPSTAHHGALPPTPGSAALWSDYMRRCAAIKGVTHGCVLDVDQQRALASSTSLRMAERLAAKGAMLHAMMADTANVLGLGPAEPDALITLSHHLLLIRPMPGKPRVALHLVIERDHGHIDQIRQQLQQIDSELLGGAH